MGRIIKLLRILFQLITILSISGCIPTPSPWHQIVPRADIIFQSNVRGPYELNFINADGSNHQVLNLNVNFIKPVWSSDGTLLYGLSSPPGQFPYEDIGYPSYWNTKSSIFKRCSENLPYYAQIEEYSHTASQNEVLLYNVSEIVIFDMDSCHQKSILVDFNNQTGVYGIHGFSYFPATQELIYGRYTIPNQSRKYSLIKLDLVTNKQVDLAEGINPSWSPNGQRIAYTGLDGLYVMQADGQESRVLINRQFYDRDEIGGPSFNTPKPYWSPDGKWLVYHQCIENSCDVKQTPIY